MANKNKQGISNKRVKDSRNSNKSAGDRSSSNDLQKGDDRYDLLILNRHWYRRCIDQMSEFLKSARRDPSVHEVKQLCDQVISEFLMSVAGQAPDSTAQQYPADRAFFIPFHGDRAEKFNFAKCFYQFPQLRKEDGTHEELSSSLWSFYPWFEEKTLGIDNRNSVKTSSDGQTVSTIQFSEMISVREIFRQSSNQDGANGKDHVQTHLLRKALLTRGETTEDVERVFRNDKEHSDSRLQELSGKSLVAMFKIYRQTPGNSGVESLLLNQLYLVRWFLENLHSSNLNSSEVRPLSNDAGWLRKIFEIFLANYFLDEPADYVPDVAGVEDSRKQMPTQGEQGFAGNSDEQKLISKLSVIFSRNPGIQDSAEVKQEVLKQLQEQAKSAYMREFETRRDEEANKPEHDKYAIEDFFETISQHLLSFREDFLNPGIEVRLDEELRGTLGANPYLAGNTEDSFVWVCPDFAVADRSLPEGHNVHKGAADEVQRLSQEIVKPYVEFFRELEELQTENEEIKKGLKKYWRALGRTDRVNNIFSSYEGKKSTLNKSVDINPIRIANDEMEEGFEKTIWERSEELFKVSKDDPRPQNIFLRVKICDSKKEPVINGLFVFTSDYDEEVYKGIPHQKRNEDVQDLLSFAKVYFFIIRDYLQGLDRAKVAVDLDKLNQDLYDKSLARLENTMEARLTTPQFTEGGLNDENNWQLFLHEIVNSYAFSLIDKPPEVRQENIPIRSFDLVADRGRAIRRIFASILFVSIVVCRTHQWPDRRSAFFPDETFPIANRGT